MVNIVSFMLCIMTWFCTVAFMMLNQCRLYSKRISVSSISHYAAPGHITYQQAVRDGTFTPTSVGEQFGPTYVDLQQRNYKCRQDVLQFSNLHCWWNKVNPAIFRQRLEIFWSESQCIIFNTPMWHNDVILFLDQAYTTKWVHFGNNVIHAINSRRSILYISFICVTN